MKIYKLPVFLLLIARIVFLSIGIGNQNILKMACYNPADFFHESDKSGSLTEGRKANLVLLMKNPLEKIENI